MTKLVPIEGEILMLRCDEGDRRLPLFVLVAEGNEGLEGVVSLTSTERNAVAVAIADEDEWRDLGGAGGRGLENRVS